MVCGGAFAMLGRKTSPGVKLTGETFLRVILKFLLTKACYANAVMKITDNGWNYENYR